MPKYFYNDANGETQGPYELQEIQKFADQGIITPETPLATDTGHTGLAGQIPGLRFRIDVPISDPPPYAHTVPQWQDRVYSQTSESTQSIFLWLLDFAFRDIRLPVIILWVCRIWYAVAFGVAVLWGVFSTVVILIFASQAGQPRYPGQFGQFGQPDQLGVATPIMAFFSILAVWLFVTYLIVMVRLACEFVLMVINWINETTKAARIYIENNKRE